jgi:hypothetical protein
MPFTLTHMSQKKDCGMTGQALEYKLVTILVSVFFAIQRVMKLYIRTQQSLAHCLVVGAKPFC